MLRAWTASLIVGLLAGTAARAQDAPTPFSPREAPSVSLGRPQVIGAPPAEQTSWAAPADDRIAPTSYQTSAPNSSTNAAIVPVQATAPVPPPAFPPAIPAPNEQYNCGVVTQQPPGFWASIWEGPKRLLHHVPGMGSEQFEGPGGRCCLQSDHCFDQFISPVTNPFLFEDPRALTEIRPIFIFQQTPNGNSQFHGGDIEYFGLQARVAFTDWFSLVVNKFGATWIEPHEPHDPDFNSHAGFSEVWLGPKFTFWRNDECGRLGAFGITFEIPAGDSKVFQDTGTLSVVPYLSFGQNFLKSSYGSFNALETTGYSFSVNNERSDNVFVSLHLDYDIANLHRFYPLIEGHWFYYTKNGTTQDINFEGRDLFNFGSEHVKGHSEASLAAGLRVKITDFWTAGFAAEFPVTSKKDLMDYRLTFDMIFRY